MGMFRAYMRRWPLTTGYVMIALTAIIALSVR